MPQINNINPLDSDAINALFKLTLLSIELLCKHLESKSEIADYQSTLANLRQVHQDSGLTRTPLWF